MEAKWPEAKVTTFIKDYEGIYRVALRELNDSVGGGWIGRRLPGVIKINQVVEQFLEALNSVVNFSTSSTPTKRMNDFLSLNDQLVTTTFDNLRSEYPSAALDFFKEIGHQLRKGPASSRQIGTDYLRELQTAGGDSVTTYYKALQNDNTFMSKEICTDLGTSCLETLFCTTKGICLNAPPPVPTPQSQELPPSQPLPQPIAMNSTTNPQPEILPTTPVSSPSSNFDINDVVTSVGIGIWSGTTRGAASVFSPRIVNKCPKLKAFMSDEFLIPLLKTLIICGVDFNSRVFLNYYEQPENVDRFINVLLFAAIETGKVLAITTALEIVPILLKRFKGFVEESSSNLPEWPRRAHDAMANNGGMINGFLTYGFFPLAAVVIGPGKSILGKIAGVAGGVAAYAGTQYMIEKGPQNFLRWWRATDKVDNNSLVPIQETQTSEFENEGGDPPESLTANNNR